MPSNTISILAFFLLFSMTHLTMDIDLLNLKTHWAGHGVSFLYPKHLKILSNRLTSQSGFMTSYNILPAGELWELKGTLQLKCSSLNEVADDENDVGVGIFLTKNNPRRSVLNYNYDFAADTFGMVPEIEGLSLLFSKNNLYTGLFKTKNANRAELLTRSKICKAYLQKSGKLMFSIKYRSKVLGIYIAEEKERFEHLCYQFTDIEDFSEFYITVSGSDRKSACSAELSDLVMSTEFTGYQIISNEDKKPDEPTYTYFTEAVNTQKRREFDHFHTVYEFYRDNAKIFAKSLLTFADYNEKEVVHEMKSSIQNTEKAIDDAMTIIELEARQIEALNNLLNSERRSVTSDVNETLDQILKWLSTMDTMFDKVDSETQNIHAVLAGLNFEEKLEGLVSKVQGVGDSLAKAIGKTKIIVKPSKMNDLDEEQINSWKDQVQGFQTVVNDKLSKEASDKLSKLQVLGFTILGIIAFCILMAFLVMYCKIRTAMRNKRML